MTENQVKLLALAITASVFSIHLWLRHGHKRHEAWRKFKQRWKRPTLNNPTEAVDNQSGLGYNRK